MIAITNFWELEEAPTDALHRELSGDAYSRKDIDDALDVQDVSISEIDMSDYTYFPVVTESTANQVESRFGVRLSRASVRRRVKQLYELIE